MTLTRRQLIVLVGLAVVAGAWLLRPDRPRASRPTAGVSVIAFGDSLVEGRGATAGRDFVTVLSSRVGVPIVNAGRSGDTTRSALSRLDGAVLSRQPRVVIVLLGGNDFLRRLPRQETFGNIEAIVVRIRQRGAAVVLVGIEPGFGSGYGRAYADVARRTSSGLVPDVLDGILGRADRMADGIHPNDRGHEMIADRIEPALREVLR